MWNRGKLVIVAILAVALFAAGFSAWYHYRGGHRTLDFWGTTSAVLIAEAPHVELLSLGEAGPIEEDAAETDSQAAGEAQASRALEFGDQSWKVLSSKDGGQARGMANVRRALVLDTTFDWNTPPDDDEPEWQYALGFNDKRNWVTVLFDFETGRVALTGGKKTARLDPAANRELREFFAEELAEAAGDASPAPGEQAPAETATDEPTESPAELK